nr:ABC transporter ATP-binding protein [Pelomonas sp. P8]
MTFDGVSKIYRKSGEPVVALDSFSLSISTGEIVGLLGPNGSGKTTCVKLATGLVSADEGIVSWRGDPLPKQSPFKHLREMGVLLEGRGAAYDRLSILENSRYFCKLRESKFDASYFSELVDALEIEDVNTPIRQLSTGNKLRAGLLGSLIHKPTLLLLDEPTLGMDIFGVECLERILQSGVSKGVAFVLSSHDLDFVERLSSRIVCISGGRKVFDGDRSHFMGLSSRYLLSLDIAETNLEAAREALSSSTGRVWRFVSASQIELHIDDYQQVCKILIDLLPVLSTFRGMELRSVSLADRYKALIEFQREGEGPMA